MSKVITANLTEKRTEATILNMGEHLDVFMQMIGCDPLADRFPMAKVRIRTEQPPDDFFEPGSMIIVSDRLKTLLVESSIHAEFFRLQILFKDADYVDRAFFFCHILDCVDCFDYGGGICTFHKKPGFTSRIDTIERLVIDEEKARHHQMFRMGNGLEYIVCVSDDLAEKLLSTQFTGFKILAPEDWYFGC